MYTSLAAELHDDYTYHPIVLPYSRDYTPAAELHNTQNPDDYT